MNFKHTFTKVLKRTRILPSVNFEEKTRFKGVTVKVPLRHGLGYGNLFLKSSWLPTLSARLLASAPGPFIDVGVNIGQTLVVVKAVAPEVRYIGFEPNVSCCCYVKELIRANDYRKADVYNLALSDKLAHLLLEMDSETDSRASVVSGLRPNFFSRKDRVLAFAYDDLQIDEPMSVIKIDVEGAEYGVLKGMQKSIRAHQPTIICEVLDIHSEEAAEFANGQVGELNKLLASLNYKIIQLEQSGSRGEIVGFRHIDRLKLVNWTKESAKLNDYVFVPAARLTKVQAILQELT